MNELSLWQTLWSQVHEVSLHREIGGDEHFESEPGLVEREAGKESARDAEPDLLDALDRLGDHPLRLRAAFAGFIPWLWASRSLELRRRAVRLLMGSGTPAALRIAIEALDDDDDQLRATGLAVLRTAAERAPLRFCHALFHPRADVRGRAIEALPHPDAARMLPWLRADPEHGTHPAVMEAPLGLGLAFELWRDGQRSAAELAQDFGQADPQALMAVLRSGPLRDQAMVGAWLQAGAQGPPESSAEEAGDVDVLDTWCVLWQQVPAVRDAMVEALAQGLAAQRNDRERVQLERRVAAAARKHYDAHPEPEVEPLASIAVACAPGLMAPTRWTTSAQKVAARGLHRQLPLRTKVVPTHLPSFIDAPVAKNEDGSADITVALELVAWFGTDAVQTLEPRFPGSTLEQQIAATPRCWPALVEVTDDDQQLIELIERVRAHDRAAGLRIIALGLGRWMQVESRASTVDAIVTSLPAIDAVEVLGALVPPTADPRSLDPAIDRLAPRVGSAYLVQAVSSVSAEAEAEVAAHVLSRLLSQRPAANLEILVGRLARPQLRALVDLLMDHVQVEVAFGEAHRRALARALHLRGPAAHANVAWSAEQWPAIEAWISTTLAAVEPALDDDFDGLEVTAWLTHRGRGLADILHALIHKKPWSTRVRMVTAISEAIVEQLGRSTDESLGTTGVALETWLDKQAPFGSGKTSQPGVVHLLAVLDEPPEFAAPIAAIVAEGLAHPQVRERIDAHTDLVEFLAPDMSAPVRAELDGWPCVDGFPVRDAVARPWLHRDSDGREPTFDREADAVTRCRVPSMEVALEAVDELVAAGRSGQQRLVELLEAEPRPAAVEAIARSVARWEDSPARERAAALVEDDTAPIWLRFRIGLGLAPDDVVHWLPRLCALAREPLPRVEGRPLSWLSPNDWDGLVALARMQWAESAGLLTRLIAGARRLLERSTGTNNEDDDEATLRIALALADSPHPHAHRQALPRVLRGGRAPEVLEARARAVQVCWAHPPSLRDPLTQSMSPDDPQALPFLLHSVILSSDRKEAMQGVPRSHQSAVARGVLDAMLLGLGDHAGCLEVLQSVAPSVDVDTQWRRLMQDAPTGEVRAAVVERVRQLPGRDAKLRQIANTFAWGIRTGRVLTGNLFDVRMTRRREDLGFTRAGDWTLHVSPGPILAEHPQGRDIVEGLILHELGHHIHHHSKQALGIWEQARKAGLGSLLNLVADEHLERNLRAEEPAYGHRLKRLATYAFQQLSRDVPVWKVLQVCGLRAFAALSARPLEVADADTDIRLRSGQVLAELDRVGHPIARFVRALRMGMGNRYGDPVLEQALALFRGGFRHLDMLGLYRVTMALSRLYGVGGPPPRGGGGGGAGEGADGPGPSGAGGASGASDLLDIFGGHETLPGADAAAQAGLSDADVQHEIKKIFAPPQAATDTTKKTVPGTTRVINVGSTADFRRINKIVPVTFDGQAHRSAAAQVRRPAARLRQDFVRLGLSHVPQRARLSGRAFDRTRTLAVVIKRDPRMLVARQLEVSTDLFMGVAIDCSGSMSGQGIQKARRFGVLLAEAARGMHNVDAHFVGFTDRVIYDAGNERICGVTALQANGGNNDAAALAHVAGLARASRRRSKLLIMVSDGLPTECSTTALRTLVTELSTRHKMLCAQIAVTRIREPCFEHYIEVLDEGMDVSVRRFGEIVVGLARQALRR